jgi:uncharacterized lipoprotein NlpE involved in copper resistance
MRPFFMIVTILLLAACSPSPNEEQGATVPDAPVDVAPVEWTGYYDGTLPCADCEGILTQLWVRSDSTLVVRRSRLGGSDELPEGKIAMWSIVDSFMVVGERQERWKRTRNGMVNVDDKGQVYPGHQLERLADELQDEIPRMKVTGTFIYYADAMSFKPCGSTFSWPAAGGEQWTDEGEVLGSLNSADLQQHYLRSVSHGNDPWIIEVECNMAMGPAMEGDGADEYIFIHRVLGSTQCP